MSRLELSEVIFQFTSSLATGFIFTFILGSIYRQKRYGGLLLVASAPRRPERPDAEYQFGMFGVRWTALIERSRPPARPYVYIEGPFCPNCMFELTAEMKKVLGFFNRYYWKCAACNVKYKRPSEPPDENAETVRKIVESEIRTGKILNYPDNPPT